MTFERSLLEENSYLKGQLEALTQRLHNVTSTKDSLEGQLGKVKTDLDVLKLNTSRMEGEKEGLEKVLSDVKHVKILDKRIKEEEEDDDESSDISSSSIDDDDSDGTRRHKKKAKVKANIEKIVKEHIEKLGLGGSTAAANKRPAAKENNAAPQMNVLPVPIPMPMNLNGALNQQQQQQPQPQQPQPPPLVVPPQKIPELQKNITEILSAATSSNATNASTEKEKPK